VKSFLYDLFYHRVDILGLGRKWVEAASQMISQLNRLLG